MTNAFSVRSKLTHNHSSSSALQERKRPAALIKLEHVSVAPITNKTCNCTKAELPSPTAALCRNLFTKPVSQRMAPQAAAKRTARWAQEQNPPFRLAHVEHRVVEAAMRRQGAARTCPTRPCRTQSCRAQRGPMRCTCGSSGRSAIFLCPRLCRSCRTPGRGTWPLHASKSTACTHGPRQCLDKPASNGRLKVEGGMSRSGKPGCTFCRASTIRRVSHSEVSVIS